MNFYRITNTNPAPRALLAFCVVTAAGFCAGIVNGLLGTGGGILLLLILRRVCKSGGEGGARDAFASSIVCILPLSVLSLGMLLSRGEVPAGTVFSWEQLPLGVGAVCGGALGAYLLPRLKVPVLELLFAGLLIFSGIRMVMG